MYFCKSVEVEAKSRVVRDATCPQAQQSRRLRLFGRMALWRLAFSAVNEALAVCPSCSTSSLLRCVGSAAPSYTSPTVQSSELANALQARPELDGSQKLRYPVGLKARAVSVHAVHCRLHAIPAVKFAPTIAPCAQFFTRWCYHRKLSKYVWPLCILNIILRCRRADPAHGPAMAICRHADQRTTATPRRSRLSVEYGFS